jgi:Icc-related predicted phosphoesterase
MHLTAIADTHNLHRRLQLPGGEVLLHAGDITEYGTEEETADFIDWFAAQPYTHKIFIAGNHDYFFEQFSPKAVRRRLPAGVHYLENSGVMIEGKYFWGSPVTPYFFGMAFNKKRGEAIREVWQEIPLKTDVLLTHGPPAGILDQNLGCEDLKTRIEKVKPALHIFGHIHEGYGKTETPATVFINAAQVSFDERTQQNRLVRQPVCFEI